MISVIVPVYNVERYLRRCVDSILAQTCRDLEIILVDDGSTDGCPSICDGYAAADSRVKVIHKANGGLSDARNAGLEIASGEWVGFVDSDDFIMPEMYETLLRACVEHGVSIAMCGRRLVDEADTTLRYEYCFSEPVMLSAEEALRSLLMTEEACDSAAWDKLYRRDLFEGVRYPVGVHYEDQAVTPRLLCRAGEMMHVGRPLYVYLKRADSIAALAFNPHSMDEVRQAEAAAAYVKEHCPELEKEASYFIYYKMGFPLCKAVQCGDRALKPYMTEVLNDSRRCMAQVMGGALTVKHKLWYLKNYAVLKLRLWRWGMDD